MDRCVSGIWQWWPSASRCLVWMVDWLWSLHNSLCCFSRFTIFLRSVSSMQVFQVTSPCRSILNNFDIVASCAMSFNDNWGNPPRFSVSSRSEVERVYRITHFEAGSYQGNILFLLGLRYFLWLVFLVRCGLVKAVVYLSLYVFAFHSISRWERTRLKSEFFCTESETLVVPDVEAGLISLMPV